MPLPKFFGIAKGWPLAPGQVGAAIAPPALLPVATSAPVVSGSPIVGSTLSASEGAWSNGPILSRGRQWYASADGDDGWAAVEGATEATYDAAGDDEGRYLRVGEVASNITGPGAEVFSAAVGPVEAAGAVVSLRFGAETKAGVGKPVTGSAIALGNAAGHWQVTGGKLCVSTAGDGADLNAGPYNLLLNNGEAISVEIDANAFDVTTQAEYDVALPLAAASPPNGKTIFLAAGMTFDPKLAFDHPAFEKYFTGTPFIIDCRDRSVKATVTTDIHFRGGGQRIMGLKRLGTTTEPIVFDCSASYWCDDIRIQHCEFAGTTKPITGSSTYSANGAADFNTHDLIKKNNSQYRNITVSNNRLSYFKRMIVLGAAGTNYYCDNIISEYFSQGFSISLPADGTKPINYVQRNVVYHPVGDSDDFGNPHPDAILLSGKSTATVGMEIHVDYNVFFKGASRGDFIGIAARDFVQGATDSGQFFTGTAIGNLICGGEGSELLLVENAQGFVATDNTVMCSGLVDGTTAQFKVGHITSSGTHTIARNIYEYGVFGGEPSISSNRDIGTDRTAIPYSVDFVGPTFVPTTVEEALAQFRNRAGGPADLVGAGAIPA